MPGLEGDLEEWFAIPQGHPRAQVNVTRGEAEGDHFKNSIMV